MDHINIDALQDFIDEECCEIACLLDLLAATPHIGEHSMSATAVSIIKSRLMGMLNQANAAIDCA